MNTNVGFSSPGLANRPSPSVWADCPGELLNQMGNGVYAHEDFIGGGVNATPTAAQTVGTGVLTFSGDADTSIGFVADHRYGAVDIETDTTAGDAGALYSQVFGRISKGSGEKLWAEVYMAPGDVDDDMGTFFGLVEEDGANHDLIADDPATNASVSDNSLIGFYQNNANPDAYNIITKVAGSSVNQILADATNATGIPSDERGSLTDLGFKKLGIRFDGRDKIYFYVNGYLVATKTLDETIDQSQDYAVIVAVKTGDSAAEKLQVGWVRFAFQEASAA